MHGAVTPLLEKYTVVDPGCRIHFIHFLCNMLVVSYTDLSTTHECKLGDTMKLLQLTPHG